MEQPYGPRVRAALAHPPPALVEVWETPAQSRPVAAVVSELIDLIARRGDLSALPAWRPAAHRMGPPPALDPARASGEDLLEFFFAELKPRQRLTLERRLGPLDGEGATLAQVGREMGVTRERVRQMVQSALEHLASAEECARRAPIVAIVRALFATAGGVLREEALAARLLDTLAPPHPDLGPVLRALLCVETEFQAAGPRIWALASIEPARVARVQEAFYARLRLAGRPLPRSELIAALSTGNHGECPRFLAGCLDADVRLTRVGADGDALREWEEA
jgi:hypothetical protein